jgi:uncharacterized HAD superfamily protein
MIDYINITVKNYFYKQRIKVNSVKLVQLIQKVHTLKSSNIFISIRKQ